MRSGKPICAPPCLRSFCNVAYETVPMFVWLTMVLSRPFEEDRLALPLSTPLSSRRPKLQALVYDILPSTTAVFSYAKRSRKLPANEQFFCWCSNSSKFVTHNPNYIRRLFYNWPCCLCQLKWNQNCLNRDRTSFFLLGVDAPHVYVWA